MYILAKEGADAAVLDIPRKPIGTGPYYLTEDSEVKYRLEAEPELQTHVAEGRRTLHR